MRMRWWAWACVVAVAAASLFPMQAGAGSPPAGDGGADAAERGREALFGRCFSSPLVSRPAFERLWKQWGLKARPDDFVPQVRRRYGLHDAPYPNDGLPMGLRPTTGRDGRAAVGIDCMLCHGSSLFGRPVIGLPNTSIDLARLFRDLDRSDGGFGVFPYRFSNVRGTTESTATGIFLMALREPDLGIRLFPAPGMVPVPDQLCEDAPAWWLLKRKATMYANGQIDARAVRPLMTFMLNRSAERLRREEPTFADIRQFLLTLEPPKYPLAIEARLAERGRAVFEDNCARCHGTYGSGGRYPNKIVPLERIGTDPSLVRGLTPAIEEHFRRSWFTQESGPDGGPFPLRYNAGYQAPPLDGVWATAPYLHNGSIPTLHHLLKSSQRPGVFTRSYGTGVEDFDFERVGWKATDLAGAARDSAPALPSDAFQIYDTSKPGRSNAGHTFGDDLTDEERWGVIEYLKTL